MATAMISDVLLGEGRNDENYLDFGRGGLLVGGWRNRATRAQSVSGKEARGRRFLRRIIESSS